MEINITAALKRIGESFPFTGTLLPDGETYQERSLTFKEPIAVEGFYAFDGESFLVTGDLHTTLQTRCARCNELFEEPIAVSFSERFEKASLWGEEHETYAFEGDRMQLDEMVMDNLFLNLPLAPVCRDDCKGLCPVCGANRNYTDCGCEMPEAENPFAVLKQMTNKHKEV